MPVYVPALLLQGQRPGLLALLQAKALLFAHVVVKLMSDTLGVLATEQQLDLQTALVGNLQVVRLVLIELKKHMPDGCSYSTFWRRLN